MKPFLSILVVVCLAISCVHRPAQQSDKYVESTKGVVVSVSGPASDVGVEILRQGGNAVDAAIATAFALQVTYPLAGNIGGGGFMLVHPGKNGGDPVVFDYRETAPTGVSPTMFTKTESQYTHKCVAVPGTVRGLSLAHKRFGTLPWSNLIAPAIKLARDGFAMDAHLAKSSNETLAEFREFAELQRVYGKSGGGLWQAGDRIVQPDLARTLQILANSGPEAFYTGPIAREIVAEMKRGNGLITEGDLANYKAIERKPLTTRYRGEYEVFVPPPACSGGVVLLEELNILNNFDLTRSDRWSPRTVQILAETMRRANYDRARYIGDTDFVSLPSHLITPEYGAQVAKTIDLQHATASKDLSKEIEVVSESQNTTHFSVIDKNGMAVANTYTLERRWGSRIVVKNMGFILNNDMRAFNLFPGQTDTTGNVGTTPNQIAVGKRPLSSMTPTIVAKGGHVVFGGGCSGSRAIPHTILEILINAIDYKIPFAKSVQMPRFTQEWFPDEIKWERVNEFPETIAALQKLGYKITPSSPLPFQGDAHTIFSPRPHRYIGVADDRISGKASGW